MEIPKVLQKSAPRDISYSDDLFKSNRKKVKGIFIGAAFIIPALALIFWLKYNDVLSGIYWGFGIAAFFELFGLAMMMNAKKAAEICRNGNVTIGTVQKSKIAGNTGKYTTKDSAGYIFITVSYKENLGQVLTGMVSFVGAKKEIDLKEGDEVPVVYSNEKPQTFLLYSESLGISTIGKAK